MNCPLCRNGRFTDGKTTMTVEKGDAILVVRDIPARVCDNCGDGFIRESIGRKVSQLVQDELRKGVQMEVLNFAA